MPNTDETSAASEQFITLLNELHGRPLGFLRTLLGNGSDTAEVRQYFNGGRISRHRIKMARTLTPDLLKLGNWSSPPKPEYRKQPVRNFIGDMDEFSIYSKALKDSDIERLAK